MYEELYKPLQELYLPDFSEKTLKEFKKIKNLGIKNIYDLLYYFPRGYDNRSNLKNIIDIQDGEYIVISATLVSVNLATVAGGRKIVKAKVKDETGYMDITWFGMPYLAKTLKVGEKYYFIGTAKYRYGLEMANPEYKLEKSISNSFYGSSGEILPVYGLTKSVNQNSLRKFLKLFLQSHGKFFKENIPTEILLKNKLMGREEALLNMHFPKSEILVEKAKERFAFEELFLLEMGILSSKYIKNIANQRIYKLEDSKNLVKEFLNNMKFSLTTAQKRVITEIYKELSAGQITNRLIQGDVGSGKTIVSMILLLYMVENGYQGVIMAPTEILATQHFLGHKEDFEKLGIKIELLTGSLTAKNKKSLLEKIKNGEVDIVVGTHALIQNNVEFNKLGLIIIDEQHKFGVEQRKIIRDKGVLANLIVMSATPIPRSLALSIYGDLDVSIIDELPPGRKPIKTKAIADNSEEIKMYKFIEKKLQEGRQAYFVAPLIEESEKLIFKSVEELKEEVFLHLTNYKIGVLHGKMSAKEKDEVMHEFKNHKLDILVATTVIEVGVNVPNSSIMVIAGAERFGLSSLHQLRGRVGRGEHQSYCFLVSKSKNEISQKRMEVMESTEDGFKIAEEDLKMRKPGEIFGTRQSGLTDFKFIDIIKDINLIKLVRDQSIEYLKSNDGDITNFYLKVDIKNKFTQGENL